MTDFLKRVLSSIILFPLSSILYLQTQLNFILYNILFYNFFSRVVQNGKSINYKIIGFVFLFFSFYAFYELAIDQIILIPLFICILTDLGGYIFGKIFKGPKLTKISPNKTYAGTIGSFFINRFYLIIF